MLLSKEWVLTMSTTEKYPADVLGRTTARNKQNTKNHLIYDLQLLLNCISVEELQKKLDQYSTVAAKNMGIPKDTLSFVFQETSCVSVLSQIPLTKRWMFSRVV